LIGINRVVNNPDQTTSYVFTQRSRNRTLDFGNFSASVGFSYLKDFTTIKMNAERVLECLWPMSLPQTG
jgi:hypothetical protein